MAPLARQCLVRHTVRADTPHSRLLRSFSFRPTIGYGYESAAPTVMGSLSDGGCGAASSSLHRYRVSSFLLNPILTLRKHDAHPEDAPQRLKVRPGTLDACAELVLHCHSLRSPLFSLRSGASSLFAFDTLSPHFASLRYTCLRFHRPSTSPKHKIPAKWMSAAILLKNFRHTCQKFESGIVERGRNRNCVSDSLTHVSIITAHSAFDKVDFSGALRRAVGGSFG